MSIVSTKGLKVWMSKAGVTPTQVVPTTVTPGKPTVIDVAATTGMAIGDIVKFSGTGYLELDGKTSVVTAVTTTTFSVPIDSTGSTGTLAGTPKADFHPMTDMCNLCLSAIDVAAGTSNPISVGTFCNPEASIPGNPTAGTVGFDGYVDVSDPCYAEMIKASEDGLPRDLKIDIPGGNGYLVTTVTVGSVSYTVPLEGAVGFSFSNTMGSSMKHVF